MSIFDEQNPAAPGGTPGTPNMAMLAALIPKIFGMGGQASPTAGMPPVGGGGSTAAVTPLAGLAGPGMGAPPSGNMPPGVPGVPPTNLPQAGGAPGSRPMPSPNAMLGSNFSFPNKSARNGAVVSTGIENMSSAIHNFKVEKDKNEFDRSKATWDLYQKAAAINPETGQPVDPHTMAILAKDPKIVRGWEKMLKMEFPREAGAVDPKTGKASQGPPQIPAPQAPAGEQIKALQDQRQLQQLRAAPGESGRLTPEEAHKAELVAAGITPSKKDEKASAKIDAEIENLKAEKLQHEADIKRLDAETARLGPGDELRLAQIKAEKALAVERGAQADKDLREAGKSKTLQDFTVGRASFKDELATQSKALTRIQSQAMAGRGRLEKAWGSTPDITPEQDAQQERVTSLNDAYSSYIGMQDDVVAGRLSPTQAMMKARRGANLDADFNVWGGVPQDAPQAPPKEMQEGFMMYNADGVPVAVKQGNKWVAP